MVLSHVIKALSLLQHGTRSLVVSEPRFNAPHPGNICTRDTFLYNIVAISLEDGSVYTDAAPSLSTPPGSPGLDEINYLASDELFLYASAPLRDGAMHPS